VFSISDESILVSAWLMLLFQFPQLLFHLPMMAACCRDFVFWMASKIWTCCCESGARWVENRHRAGQSRVQASESPVSRSTPSVIEPRVEAQTLALVPYGYDFSRSPVCESISLLSSSTHGDQVRGRELDVGPKDKPGSCCGNAVYLFQPGHMISWILEPNKQEAIQRVESLFVQQRSRLTASQIFCALLEREQFLLSLISQQETFVIQVSKKVLTVAGLSSLVCNSRMSSGRKGKVVLRLSIQSSSVPMSTIQSCPDVQCGSVYESISDQELLQLNPSSVEDAPEGDAVVCEVSSGRLIDSKASDFGFHSTDLSPSSLLGSPVHQCLSSARSLAPASSKKSVMQACSAQILAAVSSVQKCLASALSQFSHDTCTDNIDELKAPDFGFDIIDFKTQPETNSEEKIGSPTPVSDSSFAQSDGVDSNEPALHQTSLRPDAGFEYQKEMKTPRRSLQSMLHHLRIAELDMVQSCQEECVDNDCGSLNDQSSRRDSVEQVSSSDLGVTCQDFSELPEKGKDLVEDANDNKVAMTHMQRDDSVSTVESSLLVYLPENEGETRELGQITNSGENQGLQENLQGIKPNGSSAGRTVIEICSTSDSISFVVDQPTPDSTAETANGSRDICVQAVESPHEVCDLSSILEWDGIAGSIQSRKEKKISAILGRSRIKSKKSAVIRLPQTSSDLVNQLHRRRFQILRKSSICLQTPRKSKVKKSVKPVSKQAKEKRKMFAIRSSCGNQRLEDRFPLSISRLRAKRSCIRTALLQKCVTRNQEKTAALVTESSTPTLETNDPLQALGFGFDQNLELRVISTGNKFEFSGQDLYENVARAVGLFVQEKLLSYGLHQILLPLQGDVRDEQKVPIFASPSLDSDVLYVLIQGAGSVSPGQWARSLCINNSLREGTMFPYLEEITKRNGSVLVLNPNQRGVCSESPEMHVLYVYDNLIRCSKANRIVIIAHSYGGVSTVSLLDARGNEVVNRLAAIGFTDSVHSVRS